MIVVINFMWLCLLNEVFAFDWKGLNANNIGDRIADSLASEPDRWFMDSRELYYFEDRDLMEKSKNRLYPEHTDGCLLHVRHNVFNYYKGYVWVKVDKPFEADLDDNEKLIKEIKQFIFNYLYNQGLRYRMYTNRKLIPKAEKKIDKIDETEMVVEKKSRIIDDRYGSTESRY